jgi:hypothetical protein
VAVLKIPESFWKWGMSLAFLVFYASSLLAIWTNKGIYTLAGGALLAGAILLYFIFRK